MRLLPSDAHHVTIEREGYDPIRYEVVGVTESGSRGREYRLSRDSGSHVHRVCHAPWVNLHQPAAARTSGERLVYEWPAGGPRRCQ